MLNPLKKFEEWFQTKVNGAVAKEPLALRQTVAREARNRVVAQGRDQRLFPFNLITVEVLADSEEHALTLEGSFRQGRPVAEDVKEALRQESCSFQDNLRVVLQVWREAPAEWGEPAWKISFSLLVGPGTVKARLLVKTGQATQESYTLGGGVTHLGRSAEVQDDETGTLLRVNDVVFLDDSSKINNSVSRIHAVINYDERQGIFTVRDENSSYGTQIWRGNQKLEIDTLQGRALADKDILCLGRAKLQFRL